MVVRWSSKSVGSITDQRVLSSLLERPGHAAFNLEVEHGPDRASGNRVRVRIEEGMIMRLGSPLPKRRGGLSQDIALSRWENEGGSACEMRDLKAPAAEADDGEAL